MLFTKNTEIRLEYPKYYEIHIKNASINLPKMASGLAASKVKVVVLGKYSLGFDKLGLTVLVV